MQRGSVVAISISERKGVKKHGIPEAMLVKDLGIENDAHAQGGLRQVSFLMEESIERMRKKGVEVSYGDFAENIVTRDLDLSSVRLNDTVRIGDETKLKVSKIGKECPSPCSIYYQVGYCIMPEEGVFCRVVEEGKIRIGDTITIE
jgi:MOSC domain-containing protein YiiM